MDEKQKEIKPEQLKLEEVTSSEELLPEEYDEEQEDDEELAPVAQKKGLRAAKKVGLSVLIIFMIVLTLAVGAVFYIFFHYVGMLDRTPDNKKNFDEPGIEGEMGEGPDTVDVKDLDAELMRYLKKRAKRITDKDVTNILLIGEDLRQFDTDERGNTDSMIIISINEKDHSITMTSIMRDMYIYLDEYGYSHRINAAYRAGGAEYLEKCIEDYFQIEIDRYVRVNFREFMTVVDAVGGVDINVSDEEARWINSMAINQRKQFTSNEYQIEEEKTLPKGGVQHLNGNQALAYSRIRYLGNADWERTQRQRRVIRDVIAKSKNMTLMQIDRMLNNVLPYVNTDLKDSEIADLLVHALEYRDYEVKELRIPAYGYFTNEVINSMAVLVFDPEANAAFIRKVVYEGCKDADEAIQQYEKETPKISG